MYIPHCSCGYENNEDASICEVCGIPLLKLQIEDIIEKKECAHCKAKCHVDLKFCYNCDFNFYPILNINIAPNKSIFNTVKPL
jgi:hypothetical protein